MRQRRTRSAKPPIQRDSGEEQPATTKKHEAYVAKRRTDMEEKKKKQEENFQVEIDRFIKQNRLQQRVKCSPAIVSNAATLKKRRDMSKATARKNMAICFKVMVRQKAKTSATGSTRQTFPQENPQPIQELLLITDLRKLTTPGELGLLQVATGLTMMVTLW